ncbi:MAG: ABC transporter permease [Bacillota bacterium]
MLKITWLGVFGFLSLFILSISWLSVIFGLLAKNIETASSFTFLIMFLPYLSSAFVPTETMPAWLQEFQALHSFMVAFNVLVAALIFIGFLKFTSWNPF